MPVKILKYKNTEIKMWIILSTITPAFLGCSIKEKPVFLNVGNIKVTQSAPKHITITANALFLNPNDIGGTLKTDDIKVFVNGNEMATVSTESFNVPAKKEFSIPLKANISTDSILSDKNVGGLIGSLFSKTIKVQYRGDIVYKALGLSYTYKVDETENVNIKL